MVIIKIDISREIKVIVQKKVRKDLRWDEKVKGGVEELKNDMIDK
ncbi:MAG: hypothetical protein PVH88_08230 [Ignavibacteria bacterium]|jgi:hypothetical protein